MNRHDYTDLTPTPDLLDLPDRSLWRHEYRDSMSLPPDFHKWCPLDSHLLHSHTYNLDLGVICCLPTSGHFQYINLLDSLNLWIHIFFRRRGALHLEGLRLRHWSPPGLLFLLLFILETCFSSLPAPGRTALETLVFSCSSPSSTSSAWDVLPLSARTRKYCAWDAGVLLLFSFFYFFCLRRASDLCLHPEGWRLRRWSSSHTMSSRTWTVPWPQNDATGGT